MSIVKVWKMALTSIYNLLVGINGASEAVARAGDWCDKTSNIWYQKEVIKKQSELDALQEEYGELVEVPKLTSNTTSEQSA